MNTAKQPRSDRQRQRRSQSGNLLPRDGMVNYFPAVLGSEDALHYFNALLRSLPWKNDEVLIFGKRITTKRKTAWFGDRPFSYTYSHIVRTALPWTAELLELKQRVEAVSGTTYNSCLLNLYHDGNEGMAWHSDDEPELERNASIASLSLGAERRFLFRHKQTPPQVAATLKETVELKLENGSLLLMSGATQTNWLHRLPTSTKVIAPRINLTFRRMKD